MPGGLTPLQKRGQAARRVLLYCTRQHHLDIELFICIWLADVVPFMLVSVHGC